MKNLLRLMLMSFWLVACGSSQNEVEKSSPSETPPPPPRVDFTEAEKFLIECNEFNEGQWSGKTSTYSSPLTGQVRADYVRLSLKEVPSEFLSSNHYLRMRLWRMGDFGKKVYRPQPVSMFFVSKLSGAYLQKNNPVDHLSKFLIERVIRDNSLEGQITNFLQDHLIILTGVDLEYNVLQIALFDESQENRAPLAWIDSLIPAFFADPKDYNTDTKAESLRELHPYYDQQNNGWTRAEYARQALHMCEGF